MGIIKTVTSEPLSIKGQALAALAALKEAGFQCCCVGGLPRDNFFGFNPKDADIEVFGYRDDDGNTSFDAQVVSDALADYLIDKEQEYKWFRCYNEERKSTDRMYGCFKLVGHDVDLIVYRDCQCVGDIVKMMDFNLNQFLLHSDGSSSYHGDSDLRQLQVVRDDMSSSRRYYISVKHCTMRWAIQEAYDEGRLI